MKLSFNAQWFNAQLNAIKKLEKDDLDLANAGQWPMSIKAMALLLLMASIISISHWLVISSYKETLMLAKKEQLNLLDEYRSTAFKAANLTAYQQQMRLMEATFIHLLAFLPNENEIPHLLDDIQQQATQQRLEIIAFNLKKPEVKHFYTELAFEIKMRGDFHRLTRFMAGISSLDRLVTLHNFSLKPDKNAPALATSEPLLILEIEAQTYRYDQKLNNVTGRQP